MTSKLDNYWQHKILKLSVRELKALKEVLNNTSVTNKTLADIYYKVVAVLDERTKGAKK